MHTKYSSVIHVIVIILVTVNQLSSIYIMSDETFLLILTESGNDFENNDTVYFIPGGLIYDLYVSRPMTCVTR